MHSAVELLKDAEKDLWGSREEGLSAKLLYYVGKLNEFEGELESLLAEHKREEQLNEVSS